MTANAAFGGRMPAVTGRSSFKSETPATFLSTLDDFLQLLDAAHPGPFSAAMTTRAASLLDLRHFRVQRPRVTLPDLMPVCGFTWGQGLVAMIELASRVSDWAARRELDVCDEQLVRFWNEAVGLAWYAELVSRVSQLPAPYVSWQAGMLLLAVGLSEQLRLLEIEAYERPDLSLGATASRQIESLVMQHNFLRSLSPSAALRSSVPQGPWSSLGLAHRLINRNWPLEWAERFLERTTPQHCSPVHERCLASELTRVWPEYQELAVAAWRCGRVGEVRR